MTNHFMPGSAIVSRDFKKKRYRVINKYVSDKVIYCLEDVSEIIGDSPFTLNRFDALIGGQNDKAVVVVDKETFHFATKPIVLQYVQKFGKRNQDFNASLRKERV